MRHRSAGSSLPRWIAASVFFGLFFGGGLAGSQVARLVAPGSGVAELVSFLALPAGFVTGLVGWAGAAAPAAVRRLAGLARTGGRPLAPGQAGAVPPGSFAFVPAALGMSMLAGVVVAAVGVPETLVRVVGLYTALGAVYGVGCWRLGRAGYLLFPRE